MSRGAFHRSRRAAVPTGSSAYVKGVIQNPSTEGRGRHLFRRTAKCAKRANCVHCAVCAASGASRTRRTVRNEASPSRFFARFCCQFAPQNLPQTRAALHVSHISRISQSELVDLDSRLGRSLGRATVSTTICGGLQASNSSMAASRMWALVLWPLKQSLTTPSAWPDRVLQQKARTSPALPVVSAASTCRLRWQK